MRKLLVAIACMMLSIPCRAIDPAAFENPYAWITAPTQGAVFHPGESVSFSGHAKTAYGTGSPLAASSLRWTVSDGRDVFTFIFRRDSVSSGSWTVPDQAEPVKHYVVTLWAEDFSNQRNVMQRIRILSTLPGTPAISISAGTTTRDGNWKAAEPGTSEENKDRVLVKYPFDDINSRVAYFDFTLGSPAASFASFSLYCAGEMSGAGQFKLSWKPGHIADDGNITYSGRPPDGLFSEIGTYSMSISRALRIFVNTARYTGWHDFDITGFYNQHRGERVTLRLEMLNSQSIGPEYASLETGWLPGGAVPHAGRIVSDNGGTYASAESVPAGKNDRIGAYPNPFNAVVIISFPSAGLRPVSLFLFDVHGRMVKDLTAACKSNSAVWNAENMPSGVYAVVLKTKTAVFTGAIILLR
ncbi:MAG: hypothetical protein A2268_07475 [Candidatus Raymondbacteria bacterium RifOxyA12_full_50_37]|uniref:Secretion system C-terminal sorting domain-containing protein n=1 Tax=Candidatus Raymondbacteria bacterium RIFOXYD12_FULL_49_13 TaxID=1817890 RepID=A0A1F7F674_UNCRA|nr:MAG: hypothetical protein A2268_07475 [Candidatus Raymondbacteria bacterium RifOxyA12_full_50_37]OGJ91222.1 MAG: hypothetical protein A2248_01620 [Candidatus Raymondbacteria bacterium RIFOXYA2_FULL_49_16]OGJ97620.1 MAG: hypothetical protein A2453_02385 [Candidatus Raymondbacteria bacterium RIFOXYC2_FULL_50_21]OGK02078.1 MAG: hypothetical protein A2519_18835 [Candidatus Raymondbacteria bacterium RIFOXYD12_FULL_49_13]OGP44449.1 MAG: hypothetical protein A2324_21120 [Candidatus Raymondbacteria 